MGYTTIRSDKRFRAELRRSRSSYTGFCPHLNPFSAELHAPLLPQPPNSWEVERKNAGYFVLPDVSKHTSRIPD